MKFTTLQTVLGSAALLSSLPVCSASPNHRRMHLSARKHHHSHSHHSPPASTQQALAKRGQCEFPMDDPNMVAVTPDAENAGWAMSPDQPCLPGHYCPFACKPGMVMAQWDPDSTYTYPASMNGGLFCDKTGTVQKPFPKKPNCVPGTGAVKAVNQAGSQMSWCQTVLPGNEAMLIPSVVTSSLTLAVPGIDYWQKTAAHFYVNPPGTGAEGCIWGDPSQPIGNWSPYVAGANTDANGNTFVKLGLNPIWTGCDLKNQKPSYGLRIECPGGGCNGLPCAIEPGTAEIQGGGTEGAGGAAFCVVTVPPGGTANIIAYGGAGGSGDSGSGSDSDSDTDSSDDSSPTIGLDAAAFAERPEKTSAKQSSTTTQSAEHSTSTTSSESSTTTTTTTTAESTTSAEKTTATASHHTRSATKSKEVSSTSSAISSETDSMSSTSFQARPTLMPGIFHENSTTSASGRTQQPTSTQAVVAPTMTHKAEAVRHSGGSAFAGLVIAFIATACLF